MSFVFFNEILVILGAALLSALVVSRLKIPSLVAYLIAGAIVGPYALKLIADPSHFSLMAELGVVLLLFGLGLEFSLAKMISLKRAVFIYGAAQVIISMLIFGGVIYAWGSTPTASFVLAGALALSSTAIVTSQLSKLKRVQSEASQKAIGVLLFQDLAAIVLLIVIPVMAGSGSEPMVSTLLIAGGKAILLIALLLTLGRYVVPHIYAEVARSRSSEIFSLTTIVLVMLAAWVTHAFGLSMALGAFVTGMMLSESHFKHQVESDISGFKDVFLSLFFVTVGMNVDLSLLWEYGLRIIGFVLTLVALKTAIVFIVMRAFKETTEVSLQSGIYLAQAGEFGLALMTLAVAFNEVPIEQASFIILVLVCSMLLSPFLIANSVNWLAKWIKSDNGPEADTSSGKVIVGGFGRVGELMAGMLRDKGLPYTVLEMNHIRVKAGRELGFNVHFGDAARLSTLEAHGIESARLLILSFDNIELAEESITAIRSLNCSAPVVVRTRELTPQAGELAHLGSVVVVPELWESSMIIAEQVLKALGTTENDVDEQLNQLSSRVMGKR